MNDITKAIASYRRRTTALEHQASRQPLLDSPRQTVRLLLRIRCSPEVSACPRPDLAGDRLRARTNDPGVITGCEYQALVSGGGPILA
jgi:hypothetical protein